MLSQIRRQVFQEEAQEVHHRTCRYLRSSHHGVDNTRHVGRQGPIGLYVSTEPVTSIKYRVLR